MKCNKIRLNRRLKDIHNICIKYNRIKNLTWNFPISLKEIYLPEINYIYKRSTRMGGGLSLSHKVKKELLNIMRIKKEEIRIKQSDCLINSKCIIIKRN